MPSSDATESQEPMIHDDYHYSNHARINGHRYAHAIPHNAFNTKMYVFVVVYCPTLCSLLQRGQLPTAVTATRKMDATARLKRVTSAPVYQQVSIAVAPPALWYWDTFKRA